MRFTNEHGSVKAEMSDGQGLISALEGDGNADLSGLVAQARAWLKEQGATLAFAHADIKDERLIEVYKRRWGMEPVALILRTEV